MTKKPELEQEMEQEQEIKLEQILKATTKLQQIKIIDGMSDEDWELRKAAIVLEDMRRELEREEFEYEIRGEFINIYKRRANDALKFIAQYPFEGNVQFAAKKTLEHIYRSKKLKSRREYEVKDICSQNSITGSYFEQ